jgi:hypothetical protein
LLSLACPDANRICEFVLSAAIGDGAQRENDCCTQTEPYGPFCGDVRALDAVDAALPQPKEAIP